MRDFREFGQVIIWFVIFLFFMLADLVTYYNYAHIHSPIPLIFTSTLTVIVFVIFCMAVFEITKHRNDKEEW